MTGRESPDATTVWRHNAAEHPIASADRIEPAADGRENGFGYGKRTNRFPAVSSRGPPTSGDSPRWPLRFSHRSGADEANELPSSLTEGSTELTKEISMFITLFAVLLVLWLLGFFAFHVTSGLIHLLLIVAVISLVIHFFRGRSAD